jgi:hypothetical protein
VTFRTFRAKGFKKWTRRGPQFKTLPPFPNDIEEGADTVLTDLTNTIGDAKIAKRVQVLQAQYPNGTIPELVTMDWLQANKHHYIYQGMLYGGRAQSGGLVPDFVVQTGGAEGAAWQVMGQYWHSRSAAKRFSDAESALRLLGQVVGGIRIGRVVNLSDYDILHRRPSVFQMALAGISLS